MITVTSPIAGRAIPLEHVPDSLLASGKNGPGIAIDPVREPTVTVAPIDGIISSLGGNAYCVVDAEGHRVHIHLGIDTGELNGFELLYNGGSVTRGQPIVGWNPADVEQRGKSPITVVVAYMASAGSLLYSTGSFFYDVHRSAESIKAGDLLFYWGDTDSTSAGGGLHPTDPTFGLEDLVGRDLYVNNYHRGVLKKVDRKAGMMMLLNPNGNDVPLALKDVTQWKRMDL